MPANVAPPKKCVILLKVFIIVVNNWAEFQSLPVKGMQEWNIG